MVVHYDKALILQNGNLSLVSKNENLVSNDKVLDSCDSRSFSNIDCIDKQIDKVYLNNA